jgi:hypothetical protein
MQGKTVLVASSELECLQLRSLVELAQVPDTIVIGIRELDSISRSEYQRLAKAGPKKVIFVGQAAEANEFGIRYASLALRDPSTYAATYLRANPDGAPPVSAILLREELAHVLVELLKKSHAAERFLGELLEQPRFRPDERTLAKLQFSELLADLECVIALHNEGQEFPFDIRQAVDALRGLYHIASAGGRELEQFLSDRYRVREDEALMAFERGFHKPNYRPGTPSKMQVRKLVAEDLKRRFRSVEMLKERFRLEHNPAVDGELSKLRALNDAEFEGDTASNSATAAAQIITAMKQAGDLGLQPPIHQSHSVLGRTNHTIEIPLEFRGAKFAVRGNGPTRKIAEDAAWREAKKTIYRAAAKLPSLLELYAKLGAVFAARSRIQDTLKDRKCFRSLKREVEALNRHGVAVSITEGKQQQRPDKSWVVPITLSFEGDPDFDEPKTMVQDLNYLGETLKAEISKSQPSVGGEEGTRLYSFCWSLSLGGTRLEGRGTDHKKIDAERHAAAALLRELEKIDPVNCILEWS